MLTPTLNIGQLAHSVSGYLQINGLLNRLSLPFSKSNINIQIWQTLSAPPAPLHKHIGIVNMATYSEMMSQIEELRKQAERQRKEEYSSVLKTIKRQIAEYGISAEELGFSGAAKAAGKRGRKAAKPAAAKAGRKPRAKRAGTGVKVAPKYRDGAGNTWTGRGKMPKWLAESVANGRTVESFLIPASAGM